MATVAGMKEIQAELIIAAGLSVVETETKIQAGVEQASMFVAFEALFFWNLKGSHIFKLPVDVIYYSMLFKPASQYILWSAPRFFD